jgi:hypothetical protein
VSEAEACLILDPWQPISVGVLGYLEIDFNQGNTVYDNCSGRHRVGVELMSVPVLLHLVIRLENAENTRSEA